MGGSLGNYPAQVRRAVSSAGGGRDLRSDGLVIRAVLDTSLRSVNLNAGLY